MNMGRGKIFPIGWICVLCLASLLCGCAARPSGFTPGLGNKYVYHYKISYPEESRDMLYQDDSLIIQFKFDEAAIRFQMQNISYSDIRIDWTRASISINGEYFAARHKDNLYSDSAAGLSISALIPPFGYIRDLALPGKNVAFDGEKWVEKDLLPTTDGHSSLVQNKILKSVGKSITLLLPLQIGKVQKDYEFEFQVASVSKIQWQDYTPVRRVPQPPDPPKSHTIEGVTAAVIVVGVLGFSAYMLTAKKNPAPE